MDYKQYFDKVRKYLSSMDAVYTVGDRGKKTFLTALNKIECDIDKGCASGEVKDVGKALHILREVVLFKKQDSMFSDFCKDFLHIIWNWNTALAKNDSLKPLIDQLLRHANDVLSYDDLLGAVERVANKLDTTRWEPPCFDLAGHYFDMVK